MREHNEFLLLNQNVTPGTALTGNAVQTLAMSVENALAHTLAVRLNRHPHDESEPNVRVASFQITDLASFNAADTTVTTLVDLRNLGIEPGHVIQGDNAYFPDQEITAITANSITFSSGALIDYDSEIPLFEVMVPVWSPSTDEATIIVYAALPQLTTAERRAFDDSTERLIELERTTMTLADLASKGYGRSEGLCGYNSVKIKIECASTEWPPFGQLVAWGMVNNQR